jgi:hypothetical protein
VSPPSIRIGRVAPAVNTLHSAFVDSSTGTARFVRRRAKHGVRDPASALLAVNGGLGMTAKSDATLHDRRLRVSKVIIAFQIHPIVQLRVQIRSYLACLGYPKYHITY